MNPEYPAPSELPAQPHCWRTLRLPERAALVIVLLGALLLSAALIYFRPGDATPASSSAPPASATTSQPNFPPGTRWYYQRGQWIAQDQQMPAQP
jgi:hypothetical protein